MIIYGSPEACLHCSNRSVEECGAGLCSLVTVWGGGVGVFVESAVLHSGHARASGRWAARALGRIALAVGEPARSAEGASHYRP